MIVISDTSPLYYASEIGCEDLFPKTFGQVVVPVAVHDELQAVAHLPFIKRLLSSSWLQVQATQPSDLLSNLLLHVDKGEAEAIALSLELSAVYLLIDERRGDAIAVKFGLTTLGLLGVFVKAKDEGVIEEVKPFIDKLTLQTKFRHTQKLIDTVMASANEL